MLSDTKKVLICGAILDAAPIAAYLEKEPTEEEKLRYAQDRIRIEFQEIRNKCEVLLDKRRSDLTLRESMYFKDHCVEAIGN